MSDNPQRIPPKPSLNILYRIACVDSALCNRVNWIKISSDVKHWASPVRTRTHYHNISDEMDVENVPSNHLKVEMSSFFSLYFLGVRFYLMRCVIASSAFDMAAIVICDGLQITPCLLHPLHFPLTWANVNTTRALHCSYLSFCPLSEHHSISQVVVDTVSDYIISDYQSCHSHFLVFLEICWSTMTAVWNAFYHFLLLANQAKMHYMYMMAQIVWGAKQLSKPTFAIMESCHGNVGPIYITMEI